MQPKIDQTCAFFFSSFIKSEPVKDPLPPLKNLRHKENNLRLLPSLFNVFIYKTDAQDLLR